MSYTGADSALKAIPIVNIWGCTVMEWSNHLTESTSPLSGGAQKLYVMKWPNNRLTCLPISCCNKKEALVWYTSASFKPDRCWQRSGGFVPIPIIPRQALLFNSRFVHLIKEKKMKATERKLSTLNGISLILNCMMQNSDDYHEWFVTTTEQPVNTLAGIHNIDLTNTASVVLVQCQDERTAIDIAQAFQRMGCSGLRHTGRSGKLVVAFHMNQFTQPPRQSYYGIDSGLANRLSGWN